MSHSSGTVTFKDGLVLHYEYDGTCDVCIPALYETFDEMWENWRTYPERECKCNNDEDVTIYSNYGNGFSWEGTACRHCMCITKNLIPLMFQYIPQDYYGWGYD
jgi:hypothetical protein